MIGRSGRREWLLGCLPLAAAFCGDRAWALGRTPLGGSLAFSIPWSLARIDPHDPFDMAASLFQHALFDSLFLSDPRLGFRPALAVDLPQKEGSLSEVSLRPQLRTANGRTLTGADVAHSVKRSQSSSPVLAPLGEPQLTAKKPLSVGFRAPIATVTRLLASPFAAIVPRNFDPTRPDGTGPFRAEATGSELRLTRNEAAAMGPAFLERVTVRSAGDLEASLRDFESGRHDLGWLGLGLFAARKDASRFEFSSAGLVVLSATRETPGLSKPGATQRLVDLFPRARLSHLGLADLASGTDSVRWGEAPIDLVVESGSAQLVETARAIADLLGQPHHELRVRLSSRSEIAERRRRREPLLSLHVVRSSRFERDTFGASLVALDDPSGTAATKVSETAAPRTIARDLRVGVLGEVRVTGGVIASAVLARTTGGHWDLGATSRRPAG